MTTSSNRQGDIAAPALDPELLMLLCDQGKYDEAHALTDRHAERITWEIEQEAERRAAE